MAKALTIVALGTLILTVGSTLVTIWWQLTPKDDLLKLTQLILSWQVIAGGLAVGGTKTFEDEIKTLLQKIASR
jgi:hypothetical protein